MQSKVFNNNKKVKFCLNRNPNENQRCRANKNCNVDAKASYACNSNVFDTRLDAQRQQNNRCDEKCQHWQQNNWKN